MARAFARPVGFAISAGVLHALFGSAVGFAAYIPAEAVYDAPADKLLAALFSVAPLISTITCSFVVGTVFQEFWRGTTVRMRTKGENAGTAFITLVSRAKRRYGGYIVHVAVVLMYIGFTGAAYDVEKEAALRPGEALEIGGYQVRYDDVRMESDTSKRMVFTDMTILDADGDEVALVSPAKFIYRTHPEMPTTEVAIRYGLIEDIYVIMASVDSSTRLGTFRVIIRPLVMWIWLGALLMIFGTFIAVSPSVKEVLAERQRGFSMTRGARAVAGVAALLSIAIPWLVVRFGATHAMGMIFVLLAGAVVLGILTFLWQSLRGAFGADEGLAFAAAAPRVERVALVDEKNALVRSLKDLEFERDLGKISDKDYERLEKRLRSRAREVLRLLDVDVAPYIEDAERLVAKHLEKLGKGSPYRDRLRDESEESAPPKQKKKKSKPKAEAEPERKPDPVAESATAKAALKPARGTVTCWSCDTENDADADWCKKCGSRVSERQCGECDTWNDPDAAFCKKCAHRFEARAETASDSETEEPK
jgi:ribosomal protein L40E